MGLFDKVLKDVTKGIQDAASKVVQDETEKAADEVADKVEEKVSEEIENEIQKNIKESKESKEDMPEERESAPSSDELASAINDLKQSVADLNTALKEADEAMAEIPEEDRERAFSTLESMAMESLKNTRVCLECDEAVKGDVKFCPKCGAKLPEKTVMELALCSSCGKQNTPGTDFCGECGAKLPYRELIEKRQFEKDQKVLDKWRATLPNFPVWNCGGTDYDLEEMEDGYIMFSAWFKDDEEGGRKSIIDYIALAKSNGFRQAGMYPDDDHLYKMLDGKCLHIDTEHCFDGGQDSPTIYFQLDREPPGGFNYVKPEPKKKSGGLFGRF